MLRVLVLFAILVTTSLAAEESDNLFNRVRVIGIIAASEEQSVVVLGDKIDQKTYILKKNASVPFMPGFFVRDIAYQSITLSNGQDDYSFDKSSHPFGHQDDNAPQSLELAIDDIEIEPLERHQPFLESGRLSDLMRSEEQTLESLFPNRPFLESPIGITEEDFGEQDLLPLFVPEG